MNNNRWKFLLKSTGKWLLIIGLIPILLLTGCSADVPVEGEVYFETIFAEQFQITTEDEPLLLPCYGELYLNAPSSVNCSTTGIYYPLGGVLLTETSDGFINDGNGRLIFRGDGSPRVCQITLTITIMKPPPDNPANVIIAAFKNGEIIPSSRMDIFVDGASYIKTAASVSLSSPTVNNDYFEVRLSVVENDVIIIVQTMTLVIITLN